MWADLNVGTGVRALAKKFHIGDTVHVDADDSQWGRVVGEAVVLEITERRLLVNAGTIQADIWVSRVDAWLKEVGN